MEGLGSIGVLLAQHPLADGQGALVEGLGGGVVPLRLQQPRQVVEGLGSIGVLLAQHPLADGQGALVEGLGSGVVPLHLQQHRQVVEASCGVGMLLAQHPLADGQGLTGLRCGFAIAALAIKLLDLFIQPLGLGQPVVSIRPGRGTCWRRGLLPLR